jgi:hypothetical protein
MSESRRRKVRIEEVLLKYGITLPEAPLDAVGSALKRMENKAVTAEREACADLAQEFSWPGGMNGMELLLRSSIAKAIRARGKVSIP